MKTPNNIENTKREIEIRKETISKASEFNSMVSDLDDSSLKFKLQSVMAEMQKDLNYFRDEVDGIAARVDADHHISTSELGELDRFDDYMYSKVIALQFSINELKSAGIEVPSSLLVAYDYLYRRMRDAQDNTKERRQISNEQSDNEQYYTLRGQVPSNNPHKPHNRAVRKRISIRVGARESALLKENGIQQDVNGLTLATSRFAETEYSRTD